MTRIRKTNPRSRPSIDENPQNEPTAPPVAEIARPRLPFHRTVVFAITLVVLFGAAVRSHRDSQNEPTAVTVDHRNRQNEATASARWVDSVAHLHHRGGNLPELADTKLV